MCRLYLYEIIIFHIYGESITNERRHFYGYSYPILSVVETLSVE